ncbi:uncharacterized protein [Choristoneura fumiferana]|uniref:uncharacterized protein n=1 Tax=Choristoneura fumiferana TaxID=7141 RepID=UPI003D155992
MIAMSSKVKRRVSLGKSKKDSEVNYTVKDLPALRRKRTIAYNRLSKALEVGLKALQDSLMMALRIDQCACSHQAPPRRGEFWKLVSWCVRPVQKHSSFANKD